MGKFIFRKVLVLLLIVGVSYCQNPDQWELRHNAIQPPEAVMDTIGVERGMTVAEVGAGRGRYVAHVAARVGESGTVYANDIIKDKLEYLEYRCDRDDIKNVETILGEETDPKLPGGKMDLVYMINTYHHLSKPVELLKNILPALKPDGRMAIIEHDPDKVGKGHSHSTAPEQVLKQTAAAGFELIRTADFLPRDMIYIFRVKSKKDK